MTSSTNVSRREFLKVSAAAGGGLLIGFSLSGCQEPAPVTPEPTSPPTALPRPTATPTATPAPPVLFEPDAFLKIDSSGQVTIIVHRSEMGQGVRTALPMILAEELKADWSRIRVEQATADSAYGDQVTGGSASIVRSYASFRAAGAAARDMLIAAAAQTWDVDEESCVAENGSVFHRPTDRRLSYGDLAATASTLSHISGKLTDPKDFRIIGTRMGSVDNPAFVTGSATFGLDVKVPGMLYAVVARCPVFGGKVASFDPNTAMVVDGVRDVVEIDSGIAVVAESTWAAIQGRQALEVVWDEGPNANLSSADIRKTLEDLVAGAKRATPTGATRTIEAVYEVPFLAHATMEPMNCVADVRSDRAEVWAPTQDPQKARSAAASITGLPAESITVYVPLMGGGFGRRLEVDYVAEAAAISKAVGAPVQVVWTREDDIQHDFYRSTSYHALSAGLDAEGLPMSWTHYLAGQGSIGTSPGEIGIVRQGTNLPYRIPGGASPSPQLARLGVPTGAWRAVYNTQNAFAQECFIDELAHAAGTDPYRYRSDLLRTQLRAALDLAADKAGWGTPLPAGWGRGIACHSTWSDTHVAQVAEVSVAEDGMVRVQRVVCAIDCGVAVNTDTVEAQMEGGIVFGLTAMLRGEITIERGRAQQSNFHDYPMLRIDEMPVVEVHILPSERSPQGVGEMGVPPIAPAVANAIFAATGKRIRQLPIRDGVAI